MIDYTNGVWLKGNLHTHTRRSDGNRTYEEALEIYEQAGYDFLAVTDHWKVSDPGQTPGGMILLRGCEYNVGATVQEGVYHIVGVGMDTVPQLERNQPGLNVQLLIDEINKNGGAAILAHPAWSLNSVEECQKLRGLVATEIYNHASGFPRNARPYSGLFVDQSAAAGTLYPCIATDDTHIYELDALGGYTMVYARDKSPEAILEALRAGNFYATQGPSVELWVEDGVAKVKCSPASQVVFYSDAVWSNERCTYGENLTEASSKLMGMETFVRAEVIDAQGKVAYSSPVKVK